MHSLAVLRYCRDVLTERQQRDPWQGWFWGIRRKVLDYWIARLEREDPGSATIADLNVDEREAIRRSHPLLMSRTNATGSAIEIDRSWQAELRDRVQRYLDAVKGHRS
ncbi:MAG TPA: hypothetical protein VGM05_16265 [Planctomycetaceae bacterium]|jgi:hypothetical protein